MYKGVEGGSGAEMLRRLCFWTVVVLAVCFGCLRSPLSLAADSRQAQQSCCCEFPCDVTTQGEKLGSDSWSLRAAIQPVHGNQIITHLAQLRGEIPSSQDAHLRSSEGNRSRPYGSLNPSEGGRCFRVFHLTYQTPVRTLMVDL